MRPLNCLLCIQAMLAYIAKPGLGSAHATHGRRALSEDLSNAAADVVDNLAAGAEATAGELGKEAGNAAHQIADADQWEKLRQKVEDLVAVSPLIKSLLCLLSTPCLRLPAATCTSILDTQDLIAQENAVKWMEVGH